MRVRMVDTNFWGLTELQPAVGQHFVGMVVATMLKSVSLNCADALPIFVAEEEVVYKDGQVKPASSNVGDFEPMSVAK